MSLCLFLVFKLKEDWVVLEPQTKTMAVVISFYGIYIEIAIKVIKSEFKKIIWILLLL